MNQTAAATSRRLVRTIANRQFVRALSTGAQVDWSKPYWNVSPKTAAYFNAFKSWVAMADAEAEKYGSPPPPIDFATAKKSIKDKELVNVLEAFYKANHPPAETHEWPAEEKAHAENHLAFVRDQSAFNEEALPILENEVKFLKTARTTRDTTYLDMCMNYPSIHEEIEDEIEERKWFKDTEFDTSAKSTQVD